VPRYLDTHLCVCRFHSKDDVGSLDGSLQMVLAGVGCGVQAWRIGPAQHPNGPELPCSPVIVIPQTQNLGQRTLLIDNTDSKPIYYVWESRQVCLGATRADHPISRFTRRFKRNATERLLPTALPPSLEPAQATSRSKHSPQWLVRPCGKSIPRLGPKYVNLILYPSICSTLRARAAADCATSLLFCV
jgi:hypothetical protein